MNVFFNKIKPYIQFTENQQRGILVLFAIIILVQAAFFLLNFNIVKTENKEAQKWLSQQNNLDSLKQEQPSNSYKIYPFNPNFITDFKGYKLGMKPEEINKLLAYRKQNKFVNSAKEFQQVTGVSDSLLNVISPYFKFPDWVNKKNSQQNYNDQYQSNWKEYPKKETLKILDINQATKEDLMKIYGVGDAISDRILKQKELFGNFVSMEQLKDIWGLQPDVIESLNKNFKILSKPNSKKIKINEATIKELGQFPYFKYPISKNIVSYRSMNGDIKPEDLAKIKDFPVDKIQIITLYLEFQKK